MLKFESGEFNRSTSNSDILSDCLKVNIFQIDAYQTKPACAYDKTYSLYRHKETKIATVVRLFASTDNGLKVCLHMHQYFPHFSIRRADLLSLFGNSLNNHETLELDEPLIDIFISDLENAIRDRRRELARTNNEFYGEQTQEEEDEEEHYIYHVERYSATSIYGYNKNSEDFYRFAFYSNWTMESAKNILQNGTINNHPFVVYNCLEFLLQFYIDNQIHMNSFFVKDISFRKNSFFEKVNSTSSSSSIEKEKINSLNTKLLFNDMPPTSTCFIECDAIVDNIVNQTYVKNFPLNQTHIPSLPGIIKLWNDQYWRHIRGEVDYDTFISILKKDEKVDPIVGHKNKIDFLILRAFIEDNVSCYKTNTLSDVVVDVKTTLTTIDHEKHLNEVINYELSGDENEEAEMNCTLQELNLCTDLDSSEISQSFYYFDEFCERDDPEKDIYIPQLDGADDVPKRDSSDRRMTISCTFQGKKIKLNYEDLARIRIALPQIPATRFLNNKNILINEQLRSRILGKKMDTDHSIKTIESISSLKAKSGSFESKLISGQSILGITPLLHSTPESYPKFVARNYRSKGSDRSLRRYSCDECLNQVFQRTITNKFTDSPIERINFILSQSSELDSHLGNDIGSIISHNTTEQSFDALPIETVGALAWQRCLEMTLMSLELYVTTRGDRKPNPKSDPIQIVTFAVYKEILSDDCGETTAGDNFNTKLDQADKVDISCIYVIQVKPHTRGFKLEKLMACSKLVNILYVPSEKDALLELVKYTTAFDPDILLGYEVDTLSWGYLLQRGITLDLELTSSLSRITNPYQARNNSAGEANTPPQLAGRIVLNVWNLMRKEVTLRIYTFEHVYYHVMKERVPKYSYDHLNMLWQSICAKYRNEYVERLLFEYHLNRTLGNIKMLCRVNLISRTFGLSCLFGMRFEDVLYRGTQFRVESMLFPLCKLENYLPVRFSKEHVRQQSTPEWIQLVLEPDSALHPEPVAVLDFQSLYPSVMIAHNYCFSTCLGKLKNIIRSNQLFGCHRLKVDRDLLGQLYDDVHISPSGALFVKPHIRRGVLPRLLEDLLYTRILVKAEIKQINKRLESEKRKPLQQQSGCSNLIRQLKTLKRRLEVCQLGLKLIANVTYGYTSAQFSGRMPCVEVADSIISKGREALEQAIALIDQWGQQSGTEAKVVYGDTDSVFVSFPGATVAEAFHWAAQLTKMISSRNPSPMSIKLEKVYQPCFLLSKKRYCGYSYESAAQSTPVFDAKGIETVRRDNCNAASKILKKTIQILFENDGNIEQVKSYFQWQIKKIMNGRISNINDFVFAKEFWGLKFYRNQSVIPSCIVTRERLKRDPLAEPKRKERVPYVIVSGKPTDRLADLVREPSELLANPALQLNAAYYIQRAIFPILMRILEVLPDFESGMLLEWFDETRHFRAHKLHLDTLEPRIGDDADAINIRDFVRNCSCVLCQRQLPAANANAQIDKHLNSHFHLCAHCLNSGQKSIAVFKAKLSVNDYRLQQLSRICSLCSGGSVFRNLAPNDNSQSLHRCKAYTCPNLFRYHQTIRDSNLLDRVDRIVSRSIAFPT